MAKRGSADPKTGYRAVAGGIVTNSYTRDMGRYTVRFDPRSTAQVEETRSMVNRKMPSGRGRAHHHAAHDQEG